MDTILQNRGYDSCGIGYVIDNNDSSFIINKFASTNVSNSLQLLKDKLGKLSNTDIILLQVLHIWWYMV